MIIIVIIINDNSNDDNYIRLPQDLRLKVKKDIQAQRCRQDKTGAKPFNLSNQGDLKINSKI